MTTERERERLRSRDKRRTEAGYARWRTMVRRCNNPTDEQFHHYGGRGIRVCERWLSFKNFSEDMGPAPLGAQIDRINNDGNYEPGNCRWATPKEQARNRRSTRMMEFEGETQSLAALAERFDIATGVVWARLEKGWPIDRALSTYSRRSYAVSVARNTAHKRASRAKRSERSAA